jgi:hypothetical protein
MSTWHDYDEASDRTTIGYSQDVEPVLDVNKDEYNNYDKHLDRGNEMRHVARIPASVQLKWLLEDGIDIHNKDHMGAVLRKLNDPDWRYLRTNPTVL